MPNLNQKRIKLISNLEKHLKAKLMTIEAENNPISRLYKQDTVLSTTEKYFIKINKRMREEGFESIANAYRDRYVKIKGL